MKPSPSHQSTAIPNNLQEAALGLLLLAPKIGRADVGLESWRTS
jgi:hypothetical protein